MCRVSCVYFKLKRCPYDERRSQYRPEAVLERDIARGDGAGVEEAVVWKDHNVACRRSIHGLEATVHDSVQARHRPQLALGLSGIVSSLRPNNIVLPRA
jgi:hypothetical protein